MNLPLQPSIPFGSRATSVIFRGPRIGTNLKTMRRSQNGRMQRRHRTTPDSRRRLTVIIVLMIVIRRRRRTGQIDGVRRRRIG